jgi:hypothetical protein
MKGCKEEEMKYEEYIEKSILAGDAFNCNRISGVQIVATLQSYYDHLPEVQSILEKGLYKRIEELKDSPKSFDDLTVIKFADQDQNVYYGIVYDSEELWQDPVVTQIFPLVLTRI